MAAVIYSSTIAGGQSSTGARLFAVSLIGFAAGATWQFLYRRDLVDRLTHVASAFIVFAIVAFGILWKAHTSDSSSAADLSAAAILSGCVYCEQWQRFMTRRRILKSQGAAKGVSATGGT